MPAFRFAQHVAARDDVAVLTTADIFHVGPIVDGIPPPDWVVGITAPPVVDVVDLDVLNPGPIVDGIPPPELVLDLGAFG
jgi:hypothetical protein